MESLKCLTKECINLLHKNQLLLPLIKAQLKKDLLSSIKIEEEIQIKAIDKFKKDLGKEDPEDYKLWLEKNNIDQNEFEQIPISKLKEKEYSKEHFDHKVDNLFLKRKKSLDIVVYSIIRVKDAFKATELFFRLIENEADFGDLGTRYSEGIENRTRGIIGPAPLNKAHPKLVELLTKSKPGQIQMPIKIEDTVIILRLESYDSAKLDDFMRDKLRQELLTSSIEEQALTLSNEFLGNQSLITNSGQNL